MAHAGETEQAMQHNPEPDCHQGRDVRQNRGEPTPTWSVRKVIVDESDARQHKQAEEDRQTEDARGQPEDILAEALNQNEGAVAAWPQEHVDEEQETEDTRGERGGNLDVEQAHL